MIYNEYYFEDLNIIYNNNIEISDLKNKSIFITGATGLIGSALIDYLLYLNK